MNPSTITLIATVGGFAVATWGFVWALFSRLETRIDKLNDKLDTGLKELNQKSDRVEGRVEELSSTTHQLLNATITRRSA